MGKLFRWVVVVGSMLLPLVTAAATTRFDVEVDPSTFTVGEFVDVTVKALDANGNVDTSYTEYVWMEIEGYDYTDPDIILPAKGVGIFESSDQGVKIFSKGLTIKKPGTYTLLVADVYDTDIQGTAEIEVLADNENAAESDVEVVSPTSGGTETDSSVAVIGTTSFSTTPLNILLDGEKVEEGLSDQNGDFTTYITGLEPGEHTVQVNALDLENNVVGSSGPIPFTYEGPPEDLFLGLDIEPGTEVMVDENVIFTVRTADEVSSAMLTFGTGTPVPTQKVTDGEFRKQISFDEAGEIPVDVTLTLDGNDTDYENVETMTVSEADRKILTADYTRDTTTDNRVTVERTYTGEVDYFKIRYGTDQETMQLSLTTSTPQGRLILAEPTETYYVQIFPVDQNGSTNGEPSDILQIDPPEDTGPVCGDGELEAGEQCDDGNTVGGDGCSSSCTEEEPTPVCGNDLVERGEECDDGNAVNGDGCDEFCRIEEEPSCFTDNIRLQAQKINDKYYLTWKPVANASNYIIYRSDAKPGSVRQMSEVARTSETMYEYPFDPLAEVDEWAWYAVEAVCENGDQRQVGNMQQVKVGPEDTLLVIVAMALLSVIGLRFWKGSGV